MKEERKLKVLQSVGPPQQSNRTLERLREPHRSAALAYGGLGVLVILVTFLAGLVPEGRENAVVELSIGAVFIVLFAGLIYRGWWLISIPLMFSNAWRAFTYFNDGRGVHIELLSFSATRIQPHPVAFINAALMLVIVFMLARSAWFGFMQWRAQRRENAS